MSVPVTYADEIDPPTLSDALSVSVLLRLMSATASTAAPDLPLYRVSGVMDAVLLGAAAYDSRRARQIVVVARHRQRGYPLDPARMALELRHAGVDVVFLADAGITAEAVSEALTRRLAVPAGGVRVLRPDMAEDDTAARHPLLCHNDVPDADQLHAEILKAVNSASNQPRRALAPVKHMPVGKTGADPETKRLRLQVQELRKDLRAMEDRLAAQSRPVFADGYAQFRHDLYRAWLAATEEGDRSEWPLREFALGPEFLASITEQQIVDRDRVIRACVDVITGRHAKIPGRVSHRLRINGESGNSSPVRRRDDGSIAWRCAVQTVGASAARLMWWERTDNVVELAAVRPHDDYRIV